MQIDLNITRRLDTYSKLKACLKVVSFVSTLISLKSPSVNALKSSSLNSGNSKPTVESFFRSSL